MTTKKIKLLRAYLTRLWLAPTEIQGYEEIRGGFHRAIIDTMTQAIDQHPRVIKQSLKDDY